MFSYKFRSQSFASFVALSSLILGAIAVHPSTSVSAQTRKYGLGVAPSAAGTGGATRTVCIPQVTILAPRDGARTLSPRPTLFWYIAPDIGELPKDDTLKLTVLLRDRDGQRQFGVEGSTTKLGMLTYTLPASSPALEKDKVQQLQFRVESIGCNTLTNARTLIRYESNSQVTKAIAAAKNELAKARIYAANGYWYDALASYNIWLTTNPQDTIARDEITAMMADGFTGAKEYYRQEIAKTEAKIQELEQAITKSPSETLKNNLQSDLASRKADLTSLRDSLKAIERLSGKNLPALSPQFSEKTGEG